MSNSKRKFNDMFDTSTISETSTLIDEIKNVLISKNILISEQIDAEKKDIIIKLIDNNNNNIIGKISGGVTEFNIIENGTEDYKDAFYIEWVTVDDNYKGYNLGTFLIIYCIYLCKINFGDIEYIVLEDDTDEVDLEKNIYYKLGFIYQVVKETEQLPDGTVINVSNGGEMQLNIKDFFDNNKNNLLDKLNKIKIKIRDLHLNNSGGKRKKTKKRKSIKKKRKSIKKKRKSIKKKRQSIKKNRKIKSKKRNLKISI